MFGLVWRSLAPLAALCVSLFVTPAIAQRGIDPPPVHPLPVKAGFPLVDNCKEPGGIYAVAVGSSVQGPRVGYYCGSAEIWSPLSNTRLTASHCGGNSIRASGKHMIVESDPGCLPPPPLYPTWPQQRYDLDTMTSTHDTTFGYDQFAIDPRGDLFGVTTFWYPTIHMVFDFTVNGNEHYRGGFSAPRDFMLGEKIGASWVDVHLPGPPVEDVPMAFGIYVDPLGRLMRYDFGYRWGMEDGESVVVESPPVSQVDVRDGLIAYVSNRKLWWYNAVDGQHGQITTPSRTKPPNSPDGCTVYSHPIVGVAPASAGTNSTNPNYFVVIQGSSCEYGRSVLYLVDLSDTGDQNLYRIEEVRPPLSSVQPTFDVEGASIAFVTPDGHSVKYVEFSLP